LALDKKIGGVLTIGRLQFNISHTVVEATGGSFWNAGIAYRVFMGLDQAKKTGLIRFGSRRRYRYLYKLSAGTDVEETAGKLKKAIYREYGPNPYFTVRTHRDANRQMKRTLGYLNDYLGLVSLVALFLAGIGTAYLFRSYLAGRMKEMAILLTLGAARRETYWVLLMQITLLGTVSAFLASILAAFFMPLLTSLLVGFLPAGFAGYLSWRSIVLAVAMGTLGSIFFCLPILIGIRRLKPQVLFSENQLRSKSSVGFSLLAVSSYLPVAVVYWLLSVWQAHSWIIGGIFMSSLVCSILVLGLAGWLLIVFAGRCIPPVNLTVKLTTRNLYRNRYAVLSSFLAIGLGALLINLVPQIYKGLQRELSQPESMKFPSFFLFDIQPEQTTPLHRFLKKKNYILKNVSPIIEARLTHINEKPVLRLDEKKAFSREQQQRRSARRRRQNLSYRLGLNESETLVEGRPFSGRYKVESEALPEISLESRYSTMLEVGIGDLLTFDIQGIPVTGIIVNLRRVNWNDIRPNFYVLFQPGLLEDAPSTFLATLSHVGKTDKIILQNDIIRQFPNISIVDISQAVNKVLDITEQISWAIQVMAFMAVFAGIIVVYSISRYNSQNRQQEINLLKVLGAGFSDIRRLILLEFGLLGFLSSLLGSSLSLVASWIMSFFVFESIWSVHWTITIATIAVISLLSMSAAYLGARKTLRQKPLDLLRSV
ncbi:MAG: FtsX-like permease family protein, partial [Proteobacteria bacterium]|nr:FtsX-like permease family protein [Pseudomonadota bacterium]